MALRAPPSPEAGGPGQPAQGGEIAAAREAFPKPLQPAAVSPHADASRRPSRSRGGWGRRVSVALALFVLLLGGAGLALWRYVDALGPIDLAAAGRRSTIVVDRDGRLLRPYAAEDGRWRLPVGVADVDPRYVAMLAAFEDRRFERHAGVDPLALLRAAGQMIRHGRVVSGGSTLTMQVARLLEPRDERSFDDKLRQMVRAVQLERRLTKREILDLYLALAPFGGNLEGARAAAFAYFGREPK
ncbi:MAG TPA: transglycosylase domain-containing protein, partial [Salinarimonas sp.]|nr:transglycosylase domain-containing protein [Salinarimonas sp.]